MRPNQEVFLTINPIHRVKADPLNTTNLTIALVWGEIPPPRHLLIDYFS